MERALSLMVRHDAALARATPVRSRGAVRPWRRGRTP